MMEGEDWRSAEAAEPAPSWPPDRWISPSALKSYNNCPYRVRLQYLDQVPKPPVFNLFLTMGNIAHQLLAQSATLISRGQSVLPQDTLFEMAFRRLPPWQFHSEVAREGYTRDIVRWVLYGISHLDRDAQYLKIERMGHRELAWQPEGMRLTVVTKPDLVLLRTDHHGEQFVEIIDYKTGTRRIDEIPPVVMRYVLKDLFRTIAPDPSTLRMTFTYLWLDFGTLDQIPLTLEYSTAAWDDVVQNIGRLMAEREWAAQPSYLCNFCPYNGDPCTAFTEMKHDLEPF
jgi:hypothetical protein